MERILIFSDTHKDIGQCIRLIENMVGVTMIIHAGDHAKDAEDLQMIFPDIPVRYVRGNCDISNAPADLLLEIGGKRIFVTHGHLYGVKGDAEYKELTEKAKSLQADAAIFGHTHVPFLQKGTPTLINPGSMKSLHAYAVIEIEDDKLRAALISC